MRHREPEVPKLFHKIKSMSIQGDPNAESFYFAAGAIKKGNRESASIPWRYLPLFIIPLGGYVSLDNTCKYLIRFIDIRQKLSLFMYYNMV